MKCIVRAFRTGSGRNECGGSFDVKIQEQTLVEDPPDRLTSQYEPASAYQANGQVSEAVSLLEQVVKSEKQTLGDSSPRIGDDGRAAYEALRWRFRSMHRWLSLASGNNLSERAGEILVIARAQVGHTVGNIMPHTSASRPLLRFVRSFGKLDVSDFRTV